MSKKISYEKGKRYQTDKDWTVHCLGETSAMTIKVNHSAGWDTSHDERSLRLMDGGICRATLRIESCNIFTFAARMFKLNSRTTWGNLTNLTVDDYANIYRLWMDMKAHNAG